MRRIWLWMSACLFFVLAVGSARSGDQPDALTTFADATLVIGQKNFTSSKCDNGNGKPAKATLCGPEGPVASGNKAFYITDTGNDRVLGFKNVPAKNGASAKFVLGQKNLKSAKNGVGSKSFHTPTAVFVAGNQLLVNDYGNNRVLIWNKLPTKNDAPANVVVGQPDFTSNDSATSQSGLDSPELGLIVAGGKLLVADRNNNRIMIWNSIPTTNGADADVVVGQPDFTSNGEDASQTGLNQPEELWSDGTRLVVADENNHRVLIWNTIPTANGAPADVVVGQPDFTSHDTGSPTAQSFDSPYGVTSDGTSLYVADTQNNRVLVFSPFPTSNNPTASIVLGQSDFTDRDINAGNASPSAQTLNFPQGLSIIGTHLVVDDDGDDRYLFFSL
jgi:hypothetical protein